MDDKANEPPAPGHIGISVVEDDSSCEKCVSAVGKAADVKCDSIQCQFGEKLHQKSGSTSTPIYSRTKTNIEFSHDRERRDSGFNDTASLTYAHDDTCSSVTQPLTEMPVIKQDGTCHESSECYDKCAEHCHSLSGAQSSQTDSGYGGDSQQLSRLSQLSEPDSGLNRMQEYYDNLNRTCPLDKVIGRRIGAEYIDIITELNTIHIPCLSSILNMLSSKDLNRCTEVSQNWKTIMLSDKQTILRLENSKKERLFTGKENTSPTKEEPVVSTSAGATAGLSLHSMKDLTNTTSCDSPTKSPSTSSPENSNDTSMFKRFTREAQKLKVGEKLVKCVKCSAPAKLYAEARQAKCTRKSCKYEFCTLCELEYHGARDCATQPNKKTRTSEQPINSKKSKKNLRRLL